MAFEWRFISLEIKITITTITLHFKINGNGAKVTPDIYFTGFAVVKCHTS